MIHLNSNLLCVVDVETTGLDFTKHDIWQICILPLNNKLEPHEEILPFDLVIEPRRPKNINHDAIRVSKMDFYKAMQTAVDSDKALDLLDSWFDDLRLPANKNIMPLAQNWPFDRDFIRDWVGGPTNFQYYFNPLFRDTLALSLSVNDLAEWRGMQIPCAKNNLRYLATTLGVEYDNSHTAVEDCLVTAQVYKKLLNLAS